MRITYEEIKAQQSLVWLLQASELDPTDQHDRLDDLQMLARARLRRAFERLSLMAQVAEGLTVGIERLAFRNCQRSLINEVTRSRRLTETCAALWDCLDEAGVARAAAHAIDEGSW